MSSNVDSVFGQKFVILTAQHATVTGCRQNVRRPPVVHIVAPAQTTSKATLEERHGAKLSNGITFLHPRTLS
jgi:hypothetical protein